jgi:hypothetical protein
MMADSGYLVVCLLEPLSTWRIGRWLWWDKIYTEVSCWKSLEECRRWWWLNLRRNSYLYIFMISSHFLYWMSSMSVYANIKPSRGRWLPLDILTSFGSLNSQDGFVDSSCINVGEARHWWRHWERLGHGHCWEALDFPCISLIWWGSVSLVKIFSYSLLLLPCRVKTHCTFTVPK